jgi:hypothetical protein
MVSGNGRYFRPGRSRTRTRRRQLDAQGANAFLPQPPVVGEHLDGFIVQDDAPLLVRPCAPLDQLAVRADRDRVSQGNHVVRQVDVPPSQRAQFAAASAERHGAPDEGPPVRVAPRFRDDSGSVGGARRPRIRMGECRLVRLMRGVEGDPLPAGRFVERAAEDPVDLANAGG